MSELSKGAKRRYLDVSAVGGHGQVGLILAVPGNVEDVVVVAGVLLHQSHTVLLGGNRPRLHRLFVELFDRSLERIVVVRQLIAMVRKFQQISYDLRSSSKEMVCLVIQKSRKVSRIG